MFKVHKKEEYLTKRVLKKAAARSVSDASDNAMRVAGSLVTVKGNWLVREYRDGKIEKTEKLPSAKKEKITTDRRYRIYLYFVATESPMINISRIKEVRVKSGGHDVPEAKIESRYYRSLDLLYDAAELTYQAYFFDNSVSLKQFEPFAHFKVMQGKNQWDSFEDKNVPYWFDRYYLQKIS